MEIPNKRKHQRFPLRYRAHLKFLSAGADSEFDAITRNLSIDGVLLESPSAIPEHCAVKFTIVAEGEQMIWPLEFAGKGEVTRIQPDPARPGYVIALKCVNPMEFHRQQSNEKINSILRDPTEKA